MQEYFNLNFSYLNQLHNQVVVENTLEAQIQAILIEQGLAAISFKLVNGELILSGLLNHEENIHLQKALSALHHLQGIRSIKKYCCFKQYLNKHD